MNISRQGRKVAWLSSILAGIALLLAQGPAQADRPAGKAGVDWGAPAGQECVDCHMTENPGLYWEWNKSQHGQNGVNCLDCHAAKEGSSGREGARW